MEHLLVVLPAVVTDQSIQQYPNGFQNNNTMKLRVWSFVLLGAVVFGILMFAIDYFITKEAHSIWYYIIGIVVFGVLMSIFTYIRTIKKKK